ncbi:MAG: metallophosphoesterase family protein [Flavobacteriales bacterium]|nr:metallophosphoesterase family protein [Flavobacteriales bacterium]MBL4735134.1 metallophosphoesterase family protein [Flavobacteriales bacterium]PCH86245.1 MAG: YfcE family phosphodiesterase [Flavobacteriales bacterium]
MTRIGLLSDTHNFLDPSVFEHFKDVDEIWHAGDVGTALITDELAAFKPVRAVYGNIDGTDIRQLFPEHLKFKCEEVKVWMTHIGGYPKRYDARVKAEIQRTPPDLFICGHSHILKVIYDKKLRLLHINPGAAGKYGFQQVSTLVRFAVEGKEIKDLQVIELKRNREVRK